MSSSNLKELIAVFTLMLILPMGPASLADLHRGGFPVPEESIYRSDLLKIIMGNTDASTNDVGRVPGW